MGLSKSKASSGRKTHESKPSSKLAGQKYITKPESRHPSHNYTVGQAESKIRGLK
jgi:hypothetical protein